MSSLIVEVCKIEKVARHANADALELAVIKGWQCVIPKGKYAAGAKVVYVPVDSVMPEALSEALGITKYLSKGRVRCAKLRGEPSFGVIMEVADASWEVGHDVAAHYGITKFVPPLKVSAGDAAPDDARFPGYTEVENLRNFPEIFVEGDSMGSSYVINNKQVRLLSRNIGRMDFTIFNNEHLAVEDGRYIATDYGVSYYTVGTKEEVGKDRFVDKYVKQGAYWVPKSRVHTSTLKRKPERVELEVTRLEYLK